MKKEDFLKSVDKQFANEDFYDLCKAFMDVSLNSKKIRLSDGKIGANFSLEDMKIASEKTRAYLDKYSIDENALYVAIKINAHNSVDDDDKRPKAYYDANNNANTCGAYHAGRLYLFTDIPDNVMKRIFDDAREIKN